MTTLKPWQHWGGDYLPLAGTRGIVYQMTLNGRHYLGKKTLRTAQNKPTNWQSYLGSGEAWLNYVQGQEHQVERHVLFECQNKTEMHYWEGYMLYRTHAVFNPDYLNANVDMIVNTRTAKNFRNRPLYSKH